MSWKERVAAVLVSSIGRLTHHARHSHGNVAGVDEAATRLYRRELMQWSPRVESSLTHARDVLALGAVGFAYGYSIGQTEIPYEPRWRFTAEERAYYASL
mmetsp:Transcript_5349/g.11036  ORF Transcript_5349/g.11036 Transcript_5349/m.11036 type:complete len:100 (-) Transcript_5349:448-747(-)